MRAVPDSACSPVRTPQSVALPQEPASPREDWTGSRAAAAGLRHRSRSQTPASSSATPTGRSPGSGRSPLRDVSNLQGSADELGDDAQRDSSFEFPQAQGPEGEAAGSLPPPGKHTPDDKGGGLTPPLGLTATPKGARFSEGGHFENSPDLPASTAVRPPPGTPYPPLCRAPFPPIFHR